MLLIKYSFIFIYTITCAITSNSANHSEDEFSPGKVNIIERILQQEELECGRQHIVFDIDGTICTYLDFNPGDRNSKIIERFPNSLVITNQCSEDYKIDYIFFPHMMEVFLAVLDWGWNVDFFSFGIEERNKPLLTEYFLKMLPYYTDSPEKSLELLFKNRIRVFSKKHTLPDDEITMGLQYQLRQSAKKDLTVIGVPIEHTVLIDDNRSFVVGDKQYPYIYASLPKHQSEYYKDLNDNTNITGFGDHVIFDTFAQQYKPFGWKDPIEVDKLIYPYSDYAFYYIGILSKARQYMEGNSCNLRIAISEILKRDDYYDTDDVEDYYKTPDQLWQTPWHVEKSNPEVAVEKYKNWLIIGNEVISRILLLRK